MRRWLKAITLMLGLLLVSGCGSAGEKGKNKDKDVEKPAEVELKPAKEKDAAAKEKDAVKAKE
jgi:predicted component of type VI protein secretion system